ncbi:MAG: hypothetical protein COA45_02100 [Zetaproteobacteria bacterium]|nr:MAG: hypothetical protein COA45_02100 [Zetaproteobacteria bacterium]
MSGAEKFELGSKEEFDQWRGRLNKIVNPETGKELPLDASLDTPAVWVSPEEARDLTELAAWDEIKPNLGTMDQGIPAFNAVVDPEAVALSESFQPPAQVVPQETWLERWDKTKPDLGTMTLPVVSTSEPDDHGM